MTMLVFVLFLDVSFMTGSVTTKFNYASIQPHIWKFLLDEVCPASTQSVNVTITHLSQR